MPTNGLAAKMGRYPTDGAMSMLGKVCLSLSHDLSPLDAPALNRAYNEGTTIYIRGLEPERKGKRYGTTSKLFAPIAKAKRSSRSLFVSIGTPRLRMLVKDGPTIYANFFAEKAVHEG
jgi:hypothetical protein